MYLIVGQGMMFARDARPLGMAGNGYLGSAATWARDQRSGLCAVFAAALRPPALATLCLLSRPLGFRTKHPTLGYCYTYTTGRPRQIALRSHTEIESQTIYVTNFAPVMSQEGGMFSVRRPREVGIAHYVWSHDAKY